MKRISFVLAAMLALVTATPAFAHVSVTPKEANRGSVTKFSFTVPNEEAPAKTVKIEVFFPDGAEFSTAQPDPVAGWTEGTTDKSVLWMGGTIADGDKATFTATLGPVPVDDADSFVFRVLQTYDNGEVVRWIDVTSGAEEPPHPAPVVKLVGQAPATSSPAPSDTTAAATDDGADDDDGGSGPAPIILLGALFLAGIGGGIALGARRKRAP